MSPSYYALTLADNTLKVVRVDNNKTVLCSKNINFSPNINITSFDKKLVVPVGPVL
jgi:hypothetical protein